MNLRYLLPEIRTGRCSGIPWCCIAFFITVWSTTRDGAYEVGWRARYHRKMAEIYGGRGQAGFIPCPLCLSNGVRIRVRKCSDTCGCRPAWARARARETSEEFLAKLIASARSYTGV